jgi:hypothetical protein
MSTELSSRRLLPSTLCADTGLRRALWLTLIPVVASIALALVWETPGHSWGDDFAGYLMQAQALIHGTPAQELQVNARLEAASDWRTGPDAYPWGYPAILALVMSIFGAGLATLKIVSIGSMGVVTLTAAGVAWLSRLSVTSVVCVAILVGLQPDLTGLGNVIGSDVVFLALTGAALLSAVLALDAERNELSPAMRRWALMIAAVFASASYFVRSNGAVTLLAIATSLVAVPAFTQRLDLRALAASVAPFAGMCAALIIGYYALLPDGSVVHVGYLSIEPASLARRTGDALASFGYFYPLFILPTPLERLAVLLVAGLAVFGALRLGRSGFLLALYSAGHLLLVILFPYSGGQRYYLPILFAVAVLAAGGIEGMVRRAATNWSLTHYRPLAGTTLLALLFIGAIASNVYRLDLHPDRNSNGPYSAAARELFAYIREQPGAIQPVAFFKPRAMRMLGGKKAVLVRDVDSIRSVNSIALYRGQEAARWQLSGPQVAALRDFRPTFRNKQFTVYERMNKTADPLPDGGTATR